MCANLTGVFMPAALSLTPPAYFFPLTDDNPSTWPLPQFTLTSSSPTAAWVSDPLFGTAFQCSVRATCNAFSLQPQFFGPIMGLHEAS